MSQYRVQGRRIEPSIVRQPPPKNRVMESRYICQTQIGTIAIVPFPGCLPHGLHGCLTDRWRKIHKHTVSFAVLYQSWPERIPQEIELRVGVLPSTLAILAVNNLGLHRMHFQTTFSKSLFQRGPKSQSLVLSSTMHQSIIRIPAPRCLRKHSPHPEIKRIVHE